MSRLNVLLMAFVLMPTSLLCTIPCLFAHGLVDTQAQALRYVKKDTPDNRYLLLENPLSFDFADAGTGWRRYYKVHGSSLGQQDEIALITKKYQQICETSSNAILLMGVSRGASTIINFMALEKPSRVRALVLESPFDRAKNIMYAKLRRFPKGSFFVPFCLRMAFPKHNQKGIHPDEVICGLPKNMPVLFVCTKEDTIIPSSSTINLFNLMKDSGHTEVYLLVTEHGAHAKILWGPDGEQYQLVTQAFFARYGLPHDCALAQRGQKLLDACKGVCKG